MSQVQLGLLTLHPHRQLMNDGQRLPLGRRALDILSVLAEAHGQLVTKDQIMEKVWPGVMVEENAIQVHVTALRKALGDEAGRLTTVRGLGYRLDLPAQPSPVLEAKRCQSSVAVLPFANLTGDTSNEYLCDGLARELIAVLSRHTDLKVPAWQSAAYYKGRSADIRTVARQLGVETVVEGWIRSGGDSVRVGADLIDAQTGFHLWSSQFERKLADICGLDNDLVDSIGAALRGKRRSARIFSQSL
jgi:TolB-like protein